MRYLITSLACFLSVMVSAQTNYPWNPDSNADGNIGVADLLAMLSVFGEDSQVETCFKGDICSYTNTGACSNVVNTWDSAPGCGTIVANTSPYGNCSPNTQITIRLTNEGYSEGDVLHLIHRFTHTTYGESATFKTWMTDSSLETVMLLNSDMYNADTDVIGRVIFNGDYWEALD